MTTSCRLAFAAIVTLAYTVILPTAAGCLCAACAYYRLGWDEGRANGLGNTVTALTFALTVLAVIVSRK
jgi:hypothetical protein